MDVGSSPCRQAVNWGEKVISLGEFKRGLDAIGRSVMRQLMDKVSRVVPGDGWQVHYSFFAHACFTDATRAEVKKVLRSSPPAY